MKYITIYKKLLIKKYKESKKKFINISLLIMVLNLNMSYLSKRKFIILGILMYLRYFYLYDKNNIENDTFE